MHLLVIALASILVISDGFVTPNIAFSRDTALSMAGLEVSRSNFLQAAGLAIASTMASTQPVLADDEVITLPSGTSYKVLKVGTGPYPDVGELAGIKFKATVVQTGNVIDDIFDKPEPYYTRVGSGGLIKGVEEVLPKMRMGDRYFITVPGKMAFGPKGRPSSAGKPRVPGDATVTFDVEMLTLPGKEQELIDIIGD